MGALSGIRVIDLSRIIAGPWASQILADLGAEVIKVERPGRGDDARHWGPPFLKDQLGNSTGESPYFASANRGKKSITLDISTAEGQQILRSLVAESDILLENYKVGDLSRYGLGYEDLKGVNCRLVYCSVTGFGQTGPYSPRAGYDYIIQGMAGLMSVTGEREELPGGGPQKVGIPVADLTTGMYSVIGILSALHHREKTGIGQHVDMALLDVMIGSMATAHMQYLCTGEILRSYGNSVASIVPYQVFDCQDGKIIVATANDGQYTRLCKAGGHPELATDERFITNAGRVLNRETLVQLLEKMFMEKTRTEWEGLLEPLAVPCGPINNMEQVFNNPQVQHRQMRVVVPHPNVGMVATVANPIRLSETPIEYSAGLPALGEHTQEVLQGILGLNDDELKRLSEAEII